MIDIQKHFKLNEDKSEEGGVYASGQGVFGGGQPQYTDVVEDTASYTPEDLSEENTDEQSGEGIISTILGISFFLPMILLLFLGIVSSVHDVNITKKILKIIKRMQTEPKMKSGLDKIMNDIGNIISCIHETDGAKIIKVTLNQFNDKKPFDDELETFSVKLSPEFKDVQKIKINNGKTTNDPKIKKYLSKLFKNTSSFNKVIIPIIEITLDCENEEGNYYESDRNYNKITNTFFNYCKSKEKNIEQIVRSNLKSKLKYNLKWSNYKTSDDTTDIEYRLNLEFIMSEDYKYIFDFIKQNLK